MSKRKTRRHYWCSANCRIESWGQPAGAILLTREQAGVPEKGRFPRQARCWRCGAVAHVAGSAAYEALRDEYQVRYEAMQKARWAALARPAPIACACSAVAPETGREPSWPQTEWPTSMQQHPTPTADDLPDLYGEEDRGWGYQE